MKHVCLCYLAKYGCIYSGRKCNTCVDFFFFLKKETQSKINLLSLHLSYSLQPFHPVSYCCSLDLKCPPKGPYFVEALWLGVALVEGVHIAEDVLLKGRVGFQPHPPSSMSQSWDDQIYFTTCFCRDVLPQHMTKAIRPTDHGLKPPKLRQIKFF